MPKMKPAVSLSPLGHFYRADFRYDKDIFPKLKLIPGVKWSDKTWWIPKDALGVASKLFTDNGYDILNKDNSDDINIKDIINEKLYPYQQEGVRTILNSKAHILNFEMGLGKTPTTIEAARLSGVERILVICPALVRINWGEEFDRWWPKHPPVYLADTGKKTKEMAATASVKLITPQQKSLRVSIVITSYALVGCLKELKWDMIILDECHYIKENRAQRSKHVAQLCNNNPGAIKVGLSGTPITSEPKDLWHQLHVFRPDTWGSYWKFLQRYCNKMPNTYSEWDYRGLNPLTASEFTSRLDYVASRVTKKDVAHLLPPFQVVPLKVHPAKKWDQREVYEHLSSGIRKQHELNQLVERAGNEKIDSAVQAVLEAKAVGEQTCCLAYYRATAKKIMEELQKAGIAVDYVDGSIPISKRIGKIKKAKERANTLVGTISSVNVGIDLTHWTTAVFAELYWQPATMIQALGRFSRLSGKLPSTCLLLLLKGSLDEVIAKTLERRLRDQAALFDEGLAEKGMIECLEEPKEDFFKEMSEVAESFIERDEYL